MSCRATFALGTAAGDQSDLRFLFADIVTRPLGASFADWAGVSHARGGLNVGAGLVALC
ncbi:MAG: hypothetical protein QOD87_2289 [Pseudonocardiales bacterium]|jgi:uncharacterized membrane-anchored protein|nr:hypothetical protein [Pseudonocardiales bacterium]